MLLQVMIGTLKVLVGLHLPIIPVHHLLIVGITIFIPKHLKVLLVQNNPAGSAAPPLERDKNLADVPDKAAGRNHLGVYSKAESDLLCPPGTLAYWPGTTAPSGWLKRNGAAVSRVAYARLFAVLGTRFGAGDGFNTFNILGITGRAGVGEKKYLCATTHE